MKGGLRMTHIRKTCLITFLFLISAWSLPLHAMQQNHGQMTDGTFFVYNQVIGCGQTVNSYANGITANGTLGQVLTNIGEANGQGITQYAGFWHAIQGTKDTLLSFNRANSLSITESTPEQERIFELALNNPSPSPLTVTISLSSTCEDSDYTLYYNNNTVQTAESFTVVFDQNQTVKQLKVAVINDRIIEEEDEIISLTIDKIEGNSTVHIGPFPEYTINIPANDAWPITGTVKYLGSQTGKLIASATELSTGDVYSVDSVWDTNTTTHTFTTKVPPGTYTICAYIDSNGEGTLVEDEWEVKGSYTWTVKFNEDGTTETTGNINNIIFAMNDPDGRYASQFISYTGTYLAWISNYDEIGGPDEDYDGDGYTNFQEYLNGTDPTSVDEPYKYNGYDMAYDKDLSDVSNRYQIITSNPIVPKVRKNGDTWGSFLVDLNYTTSDNDLGTTGLGIAIHFNSTFFEFAGFTNVLTTNSGDYESITPADVVKDENGYIADDNFEDTDKVVTIAWIPPTPGDRNWPGSLVEELPVRLCTLKFSVKSNAQGITYGDTSVLRFTATSKDTRYNFYASPITVEMDPFNFDVDGNGKANALTDGLLIMRYLFGLINQNQNLQEDAIATDAIRKTSLEIWTYLNNGRESLDIDGNLKSDALTDGLLIMRYMFGIESDDEDNGLYPLTENAIAIGAPNDTDDKVVPYIKHYLPQKGSPAITPTDSN
jgi:hypothetical protein